MVDKNKCLDSIAYCGLICNLCFLAQKCDGCKSANNRCERNCSDEGCINRTCCLQKNIEGCWECSEVYACEKGMYSLGNMSKIKAFAICMHEDGKDYFISHIIENMKKGLSVEKGKDYDNKSIATVLNMIRGVDE